MVSLLLMLIGGLLFLISRFGKSEIDSNGFLHESLFFYPLWLFVYIHWNITIFHSFC
ncbi:DUF3955 domain-containing protein [Carnobacterium funditum]|uniref:DUF3955 domain-containing protein n=1 Tax=Carnobacterium funditum TaxID=2752 RepID=UPI003CCC36DB